MAHAVPYYELHGEGEPVMLIMGIGADARAWARQVPVLAQHHRTIVFDNRGIGRSAPVAERYSIEDLVDDVLAVLDAAEVERAHVVGLSMGGMVAQELALRAPARVDRLVLVSTSADCHPVIDAHRRRFAATLEGMTSGASFWRHVLPVPFSRHFLEHEWERLPELFGSGADLALDGIAAQLDAVGRHDTRARLGGIHAPTLVIGGGDDRLVPSECSTELARLIEGAQLRIVAGASHCLNIERADEFNDSVLAFLGNTPCERRASDVRDPG